MTPITTDELERLRAQVLPESPTTPSVMKFARLMEWKLSKNRGKGDREGWIKILPKDLLVLLKEEVEELDLALEHESAEAIALEAADVANFAMMIADSVTVYFKAVADCAKEGK